MPGPVGFGESEWKQVVIGRAQRVVSPSIRRIISNDFDTDALNSTQTSFGTVTYDTGLTGGVARLRTGIVVGAYAAIYNAGSSSIIGNPSGESWYAHARCWIKEPPLVDTEFICISVQDTLDPATFEGIRFGLIGSVDTTFLAVVMEGAGTTNTITAELGDVTGFHDYGIGYDAGNDMFHALVDERVILSLAGPFANLTNNPCFLYSSAVATLALGGQDCELWVDNIAAAVELA